MKLGMTTIGDLAKDMAHEAGRLERGITVSVRKTSGGFKDGMRNQVMSAGLGPKVAKTWQNRDYPKGAATSANAASVVWTKAPKIIEAYDRGVLLRAKQGMFLAIPTKNAPRMYKRRRVSPSNWPERSLGKLHFIKTGRGKALLVVHKVVKSHNKRSGQFQGYRRATKKRLAQGRDAETVIMFVLIEQRRIPKKLDVNREFDKWTAQLSDLLTKEATR